jgi:CubicO group peptidase (beta-lactamase class C family)
MSTHYVPPADGTPWDRVAPEAAGFDAAKLQEAVAFALANETKWQRDVRTQLETGTFEPPPDNFLFGPVANRSGPNGLILRGGKLVASWGDTRAVDMTFSVAKSYLSILAGLAVADGLIRDLDEPVGRTVQDGGFDGPHNGAITWRHLLHQTSEWEGTLFGKPDQIDRNRTLATEFAGTSNMKKGEARPLREPGSYWEYNDVRVNRLSLALLRRFGRALPQVFAERVMAPIGASSEWRWSGYSNSYVLVNGQSIRSVSGGGHWGGGVFIHAEDQARIGLMMARNGAWGGKQILSADWVSQSVTPCAIKPDYGFLWWLNTGRGPKPSAPADSYWATGAGGNFTWVDPTHDIVAVLRWHDAAQLDAWIGRVLGALKG